MNSLSSHRPKKHLGQHFLTDPFVLSQICDAIAIQPSDHLLEIGPGLGALTQRILPLCAHLQLIEKDVSLIPTLRQRLQPHSHYQITEADVLSVDFTQILTQPTRVVGNLPYQISSPLLFQLFDHIEPIIDMHFMLQKEVAQRLAAAPGSSAYGRLSVMAQYQCDAHICFDVPPGAFSPPPRVNSSFIRLRPKSRPNRQANGGHLHTWVRLAFQQRRKQLRNSLKIHLNAAQMLALAPWATQRPETLSVEDFIKLSLALGTPHNH